MLKRIRENKDIRAPLTILYLPKDRITLYLAALSGKQA